jgi:hypothetical protein
MAKTTADKEQTELAVQNTEVASIEDYDLGALGFDLDELDGLSGIESINASDIRVPYGKMYSKIAPGRDLGDIELPDGTIIKGNAGEVLKGLSILKIQSVRVLFPQPFKKSNTYTCRSLDGKYGANETQSAYAGRACESCEFSKFPEGGGASPCREQILLTCTLQDGTLFHLLAAGISVSEFKKGFMSVEMMKGLALVKKKLKRPILGALNVIASVEMQNTDYGPFPKLVFKVDKEQPLVSIGRLTANLEAYSSYKEFEQENVATATTFAQTEQGEHDVEGATGANADMF